MGILHAGNWEWFFPDNGDESIASIVGYSQPAVSSIRRHASAMKNEAAIELAMHRDKGDAEIGVVHMGEDAEGHRPDLDSVVYLVTPDVGERKADEGKDVPGSKSGAVYTNRWRAPMSIEFGHYQETNNGFIGPRTRRQHRRKWVKGIAPLQKAAKKMQAKRRMSIR